MTDSPFDPSGMRCAHCGGAVMPRAGYCITCGQDFRQHTGHDDAEGVHSTAALVEAEVVQAVALLPGDISPAAEEGDAIRRASRLDALWGGGRISRSHYWLYSMGCVLAMFGAEWLHEQGLLAERLITVIYLVVIWLLMMAQIRRWHDFGRSGFWTLLNGIPVVGSLCVSIILGFLRGTYGPNDYGHDPLTR